MSRFDEIKQRADDNLPENDYLSLHDDLPWLIATLDAISELHRNTRVLDSPDDDMWFCDQCEISTPGQCETARIIAGGASEYPTTKGPQ